MPCNCRASSCPECMGDYRPSEQPFESAYRSALVRIKQAEARAAQAEAELAALKAQPSSCDCGAALTMCADCAVEDYQAAHPDCAACMPFRGTAQPSPQTVEELRRKVIASNGQRTHVDALIAALQPEPPSQSPQPSALPATVEMREQLAALAHEQWAGWMRYLFGKSVAGGNGNRVMLQREVVRWTRQLATPYADLSESEKDSDRKEADRVLAIIASLHQPSPLSPETPQMKRERVKAVVYQAQKAIEAELPEDEPDTIPEWCYVKIVEAALAHGQATHHAEQETK